MLRPDSKKHKMEKKLPFSRKRIIEIMADFPTPFYVYDEKGIRDNAKKLKNAFRNIEGFREFFAVKATPNPFILKIMQEEGFGADCSSLPELILSEKAGITGEGIMFTSNDTPEEEFRKARKLGAIINLDDITHIPFLEGSAGIPQIMCLRYNPGKRKQGNRIIGNPIEAKYGFTEEQLYEGYRLLANKGVKRFGLHTMIVSNELNPDYFIDTAEMLFSLAAEISRKLGISFEFINLGGGIGIPYRPEEKPIDLDLVAKGIKNAYGKSFANMRPKVFLECGRLMTGPYGYLITRVRHIKETYKAFAGCDATMANLMRPAMYSAYHHITVLGKEKMPRKNRYDVTGSLCENNDKFAIDRMLPKLERNDILAIHDAGAHGHAMGFNYNGKLRSSELLLRSDGSVREIRRAETVDDYFSTLDFSKLEGFR